MKLQEPSEHQIQSQIWDYLRYNNIWCERFNVGAAKFKGKNGKESFVRFAFKGMSDLLAAPKINGVRTICFIEVKDRLGKLSPEQEQFKQVCEYFGMLYIVARSADDVKNGIASYAQRHNPQRAGAVLDYPQTQ